MSREHPSAGAGGGPAGGAAGRSVAPRAAALPYSLRGEVPDFRPASRAAAPFGPCSHQGAPLFQAVAPGVGPFDAVHHVRQRPLGHLPPLGPRLAAPVRSDPSPIPRRCWGWCSATAGCGASPAPGADPAVVAGLAAALEP